MCDITPLQGRTFPDMVWLVDYAYDVPASFQEGKGMVGGFTMRTINTTRLCVTTINAECLKVKGPDVSDLPGLPWSLCFRCLYPLFACFSMFFTKGCSGLADAAQGKMCVCRCRWVSVGLCKGSAATLPSTSATLHLLGRLCAEVVGHNGHLLVMPTSLLHIE